MFSSINALLGMLIGGYRLETILGSGATGAVFLGRDVSDTSNIAALKILLIPPQLDPRQRADFRARFAREAEILRQLGQANPPHIVTVHSFGEDSDTGLFYMVLPFIGTFNDGKPVSRTLATRLAQGQLPLAEAARYLAQIAEALDFAHARGLVHRDIKPGNILLDAQDRVFLADFSIAKIYAESQTTLTMTGQMLGTPEYMAPEQIAGGAVGPQADIYSLGLVLFEMVTGVVAFQGTTPFEIMTRQGRDAPPPPRQFRPDLPEPAQAVILRALAKASADRFPTASALAQAFALGLQGLWLAPQQPAMTPTASGPPDVMPQGMYSPLSTVLQTSPNTGPQRTYSPPQIAPPAPVNTRDPHARPIASTPGFLIAALSIITALILLGTLLVIPGVRNRFLAVFHPRSPTSTMKGPPPSGKVVAIGTNSNSNYGVSTYALDTGNGTLRWKFLTGLYGSVPTLAGDIVAVGSEDGNIYALHASNGSQVWHFATGNSIRGAPLIANGMVYARSNDGTLYALDLSTGMLRWKATGAYASSFTFAYSAGTVYIDLDGQSLSSLDANTGNQIWKYPAINGNAYIDGIAFANGIVYLTVSSQDTKVQGVYALRAQDGHLVWMAPSTDRYVTTLVVADGSVYGVTQNGQVDALDAATGNIQWSYPAGSTGADLVVANDLLLVGTQSGVVLGLDRNERGTPRWRFALQDAATSITLSDGTAFVASADDNIYALDPGAGSLHWTYHTNELLAFPVTTSGTIVVDSHHHVFDLKASNGAMQWSSPLYFAYLASDKNVIYASRLDNSHIVAIDATTGHTLWDVATHQNNGQIPVFDNSLVLLEEGQQIVALNKSDGQQRWTKQYSDYIGGLVATANSQVIACIGGNLTALNALDGSPIWQTKGTSCSRGNIALGDSVVYAATSTNNTDTLAAYSIADGQVNWTQSYNATSNLWSLTFTDNTLYIARCTNNTVQALDPATGRTRWTFAPGVTNPNDPIGCYSSVSSAALNGLVYVGSGDNHVYALDEATGAVRWKYTTGYGAGELGAPVLLGNTVYAVSADDHLYALDAATGTLRWKFSTGDYVEYPKA